LKLFDAAVSIIAEAERSAGLPIPWTVGGGTMLYRRYEHRESKDIDVFITDAQMLGAFSPRLNDVSARYTRHANELYVEQSNFIKLVLDDGEIDFIVAPHLMSPYAEQEQIGACTAMIERPAEILAKKVFYRAESFTARDTFDLAFLIRQDVARELMESDPKMYFPKLETVLRRISYESRSLSAAFSSIKTTKYEVSFEECLGIIQDFVMSYKSRHG